MTNQPADPTTPIVLNPDGTDLHEEHVRLRAQGPATRVDILGLPVWSVTDPVLLKRLLTDPDVSKDAREHWPRFEEVARTWPLALWITVNSMFTAYGADHRRLRRLIAPALSARRVERLTGFVESTIATLLDELDALPPGETVDLRRHLAYPLPIAVICHLMGVRTDRRAAFRTMVDRIFETTHTAEEAQANTAAVYEVLAELIAAKRAEPGDDMTSVLIAARDDEEGDGRGLSDSELRDSLLLMISAGYETTVNVIDQAVTLLLTHPEQLALVRAGRADWKDVVEETLRVEPAIVHLPLRIALADIPLPDGRTIAEGAAILASYGAANRHPDWHGPTADAFDLTRAAKDHLAFGHGVHFCLGAPLARLEVASALRALFGRFPEIELAVPATGLRPLGSLISNGHQNLPVRLRPAAGPGRSGGSAADGR